MKYIIGLTLLLFTSMAEARQSTRSGLIPYLRFSTEEEKKYFEELARGKEPDYLSFLLQIKPPGVATVSRNEAVAKINGFFESNPVKELNSEKKIKSLLRSVRDKFMGEFEYSATFGELLTTGKFNAATLTALFTILFEPFKTEYYINEEKGIVYPVVKLGEEAISLSNHKPGTVEVNMPEEQVGFFLDYLVENQVITKDQFSNGNWQELFSEYYYVKESFGKIELAGFLYYQTGVSLLIEQKEEEAYWAFEKAYFLCPVLKMKFMSGISLYNLMIAGKLGQDDSRAEFISRVNELGYSEYARSQAMEYFTKTYEQLLHKEMDLPKYMAFYNYLSNVIGNSHDRDGLNVLHYTGLAGYYILKGEKNAGIYYLDSLMNNSKPGEFKNENAIRVVSLIMTNTEERNRMDTITWLKNRYPALANRCDFQNYVMLSCLVDAYYLRDVKLDLPGALATAKKLQSILKTYPELKRSNEYMIRDCYWRLAFSFNKKNEYNTALELLNAALEYSPENKRLKEEIAATEEKMKPKAKTK
ncbi:MAG: hypothetical protein ACTHMC_13295 [Pseudobacter sp.]|uniref:hypothetical protein n=1 Tax=Pseudobacter sp. TaxID=2045420 RepID=UPI003F8084DE